MGINRSLKSAAFILLLLTAALPLAAQELYGGIKGEYEYIGFKENRRTSRNSVYVSVDENFASFDSSSLTAEDFIPNDITLNITWGADRVFFSGIQAGVSCDSIADYSTNQNLLLKGGFQAGFCINLEPFKPYGCGMAEFYSNQYGVLKAGGGLDIKLGNFLLNLGYTYNWQYDLSGLISTYQASGSSGTYDWSSLTAHNSHSIYVGTGLTW